MLGLEGAVAYFVWALSLPLQILQYRSASTLFLILSLPGILLLLRAGISWWKYSLYWEPTINRLRAEPFLAFNLYRICGKFVLTILIDCYKIFCSNRISFQIFVEQRLKICFSLLQIKFCIAPVRASLSVRLLFLSYVRIRLFSLSKLSGAD